MAHTSLQAQDCRIYIKNGKLRFQAVRHDLNGEVLDRVTISFPLTVAYKFAVVEDLDEEILEGDIDLNKISNRIQDFILDDKQE